MRSNFSKYFLIIMSFVFLGYLVNVYITKRDTRQAVISEEGSVGKCTRNDFEVKNIRWQKVAQDAGGKIDALTIKNKGEYDCRDIRGIIRFLSHDGTELDKSDFVIPEQIRSNETKTFTSIPLRQLTSADVQDASVTIVGATVYSEKTE